MAQFFLACLTMSRAISLNTEGLPITPACHALSQKTLPRGVVSVTSFGADPTGKSDSTNALQEAISHARTDNFTLFVPLGCYVITNTLVVTQPRNGRWQPTQIVGEKQAGPQRPMFVLPASTVGFSDKAKYRPMLTFWTNWCLMPGPNKNSYYRDEYFRGELWCNRSNSKPPWMFNMLVQDLDFLIGAGNPGAVGLDMIGAQGSTIQDVTVYASDDTLAGVAGGTGVRIRALTPTFFPALPYTPFLSTHCIHTGRRVVRWCFCFWGPIWLGRSPCHWVCNVQCYNYGQSIVRRDDFWAWLSLDFRRHWRAH